jgi:predicted RNA binding protein YcfA (HicA-like mRNA interferase family)
MKFSELYKLLEKHGWEKREGKRHAKYVHPEFRDFIPVGRHPGREVPTGTLNKILKSAGLK